MGVWTRHFAMGDQTIVQGLPRKIEMVAITNLTPAYLYLRAGGTDIPAAGNADITVPPWGKDARPVASTDLFGVNVLTGVNPFPAITPDVAITFYDYVAPVAFATTTPTAQQTVSTTPVEYLARIYQSVNQAIPNGTNPIPFDTSWYDLGGFYSALTPTRLTVPVSGRYQLGCWISFGASTGTDNQALLGFRVNGVGGAYLSRSTSGLNNANPREYQVEAQGYLNAGDYVEVVLITTGGPVNANHVDPYAPSFWISYIGA